MGKKKSMKLCFCRFLLAAAIVMLSKFIWSSGIFSGRIREKTALDILKERYARGEIESEEFMQKRRHLEG